MSTFDFNHRLTLLENRVLELERRPVPVRVVQPLPIVEGAQIRHPHQVAIPLPDARQREQLAAIVIGKHKILGPDLTSRFASSDKADWDREFEASILALTAFGRGEIDFKTDARAWIDRAEDFLFHRYDAPAKTLTLPPFTASCLVMGVASTFNEARFPHDLAFGLTVGGKPAESMHWQNVLATRTLPGRSAEYPEARDRRPGPNVSVREPDQLSVVSPSVV